MKSFCNRWFRIISLAILLALSYPALAQDPPPPPQAGGGGEGTGGTDGERNGAPIDGGLGILLALGASYGACKLYKIRKKKSGEEEPE